MRRTLSILCVGFIFGSTVTILAFRIVKIKGDFDESRESWFVCEHIDMQTIALALDGYMETNKTEGPIDLETLVRAKRLPEWSGVYVCPDQLSAALVHTNSDDWRLNPFLPAPIAAHYSQGAYYIETSSNEFRIRCRYHTNILNFTIPRKHK